MAIPKISRQALTRIPLNQSPKDFLLGGCWNINRYHALLHQIDPPKEDLSNTHLKSNQSQNTCQCVFKETMKTQYQNYHSTLGHDRPYCSPKKTNKMFLKLSMFMIFPMGKSGKNRESLGNSIHFPAFSDGKSIETPPFPAALLAAGPNDWRAPVPALLRRPTESEARVCLRGAGKPG